ncbi:MAG: type II secretion system F family protein [Eggerthellaceae bacterium]|nr:type II secretion system F family protein [Eggerthellaceae bacterium]MBQ9044276.1 type II secretion system F family protein [Eggerthellaceae bacterium]
METRLLVGLMALAAAFGCLFAAAQAASIMLRRRRAAMVAQGDVLSVQGLVAWRLRNGFPIAFPVVKALEKAAPIADVLDEAVIFLSARGWKSTRESAGSVVLAVMGMLALLLGAVTASPVAALATPACAMAVLSALAGNARDKRQESVREAVPEALESMAACLGSGFTLLQTFNQVAAETPGPLGETFARGAHVLEVGGSAERALEELREGAHASELAFVAVALDVQHQSGGAMRQVLDAATDSVKGELALRRSLRVQTAQAKLSARVVVVMPFILIAAFSLASPDFLMPFFSSVFGYALLSIAIIMQVAGILLVRRALAVEGVS